VLYPALVALMWLAALLSNQGHFITPLLLAMTATLIAPWWVAWGIDAIFGRRRGCGHVASQHYGYPVWLLGLVIGPFIRQLDLAS
jgi:hypothetical protein